MGILSGNLSVRRYRVVGRLPENWRTTYKERLESYAFREPAQGVGKEEIQGWVQVQDILDNTFQDYNRWLYNRYALFGLRTDKKTLPARLFRATLDRRCAQWSEERETAACPASVRRTLRDELEREWLQRVLPQTKVIEISWNIDECWLIATSMTVKSAEQLPKRFHQTFGQQLVPFSPLDYLDGQDQRDSVLALSARGES